MFFMRFKVEKIKEFILIFLFLIIYRFLSDYTYKNIITNLYDYQNYNVNSDFFSNSLSWIFFLLLAPIIVKNILISTLSSNIISLLAIFSVVPTSTLIAYNKNYEINYVIFIFLYWFILLSLNLFVKKIVIKSFFILDRINKFIIFLLVSAVIFTSFIFTGFRFHFGLLDVYDLRVEAREFELNFIIGYLLSAADYILPIILVDTMLKRKITTSLFLVICIFLNFGIAGSKHIIFLLFLSILGYFFIKSNRFSFFYLFFLILVLILALIEFGYLGTYFLTLFLSYRIMFLPSSLHYIYFDFFSKNEFDFFRQSYFKWFIDSPYKENIGFLISEYGSGQTGGRANNGLFSDAYFNLGIMGVLIMPFILIIIFKLIEGAVENLNPKLVFSISISLFMSVLSLPLSTVLFSTGFFILLIYLYSVPRGITY